MSPRNQQLAYVVSLIAIGGSLLLGHLEEADVRARATELTLHPPPPRGTMGSTRPPSDVRIGDFVYLDGVYQRVRDMRSAGTAAHRVLIFDGREPCGHARSRRITYRPIELR